MLRWYVANSCRRLLKVCAGVLLIGTAFSTISIGILCMGIAAPALLHADEAGNLQLRYPELANYLNASEELQATVFEEVSLTNDLPEAMIGQGLLRNQLEELAESAYSHYRT